jgi:hypothetical protein
MRAFLASNCVGHHWAIPPLNIRAKAAIVLLMHWGHDTTLFFRGAPWMTGRGSMLLKKSKIAQ